MKAKIFLKLVCIATLAYLNIMFLSGIGINPDFRPINEPFDISGTVETEGAASGTVIVLQIVAGGLLYFAAPIAVIMIVIAAFQMVINSAESDKVGEAKSALTWSIVGLLTIILSYSIVRAIINFAISVATPGATLGTS